MHGKLPERPRLGREAKKFYSKRERRDYSGNRGCLAGLLFLPKRASFLLTAVAGFGMESGIRNPEILVTGPEKCRRYEGVKYHEPNSLLQMASEVRNVLSIFDGMRYDPVDRYAADRDGAVVGFQCHRPGGVAT